MKRIFTVLVLTLICVACIYTPSMAAAKMQPNIKTETGIREYLVGEWHFLNTSNKEFYSVRMDIDKDLKVQFDFTISSRTKEKNARDVISGQFSFDRYDEKAPVPDMLHLELTSEKNLPGGDFFFVHRTIFEGSYAMSLFSAGNGGCILDLLDPNGEKWGGMCPSEMIFIKKTGEEYDVTPKANAEFYAAFWGRGKTDPDAIWLDDITWPPAPLPGNYNPFYDGESWYRFLTTKYKNETPISVAYTAADGMRIEGGGGLRQSEAYLVKTNGSGEITAMRHVPYAPPITRATITGDRVRMRTDPDTKADIITNLDKGAKVLMTITHKTPQEKYPWYRVSCEGIIGWVYGEFLQADM